MPRVALESAVITHGLPRPQNLEAARSLERAVRDEGAVPATVGVLDGEIVCGLTDRQLVHLATVDPVQKISLRDLPVAVASGGSGGTTVAATLHVAAQNGVEIFATGGIGGVHRRVSTADPPDVSADLPALARYPVCTVCAGAKAILDLPATVEALETLGVTVLGFGTDCFPAFYSSRSDLPVDHRVELADEVAEIVRARKAMGLEGGVLVVVPVPPAFDIPRTDLEPIIQRAVEDAHAGGIRAADLTPFLLREVARATQIDGVATNRALLENNARVAARIALALVG